MTTMHTTLAADERLRWLRDYLQEQGTVSLAAAAEQLGVSQMTIRRDLVGLEQLGEVRRVRGGAKALGPQSFSQRQNANAKAKARIAAKLAGLVPLNGAVAFDASSTIMRMSSLLGAAQDLIVVTNGPDTFGALQGLPGVRAMLTGGELEGRTGSLVGPLATRGASQFSYERFFTSATSLDVEHGAFEVSIEEAEVKRHFVDRAAEVVLAIDSSKLGTRSVAASVPWERVTLLVTELDPADDRLAAYRSRRQLL
jgi:DeoR family fructose operon transcriptional repressor